MFPQTEINWWDKNAVYYFWQEKTERKGQHTFCRQHRPRTTSIARAVSRLICPIAILVLLFETKHMTNFLPEVTHPPLITQEPGGCPGGWGKPRRPEGEYAGTRLHGLLCEVFGRTKTAHASCSLPQRGFGSLPTDVLRREASKAVWVDR